MQTSWPDIHTAYKTHSYTVKNGLLKSQGLNVRIFVNAKLSHLPSTTTNNFQN